jgi:hypothetical protein
MALTLTLALAAPSAPALAAAGDGYVRVDQVGYATGENKQAYLMTSTAAVNAPFTVVDRAGHPVLTGRAGADLGAWNPRYPHVRALDLSALRETRGVPGDRGRGDVAAVPGVVGGEPPAGLPRGCARCEDQP